MIMAETGAKDRSQVFGPPESGYINGELLMLLRGETTAG
jgi:hypothetical protein